jgi:hypothetical protein
MKSAKQIEFLKIFKKRLTTGYAAAGVIVFLLATFWILRPDARLTAQPGETERWSAVTHDKTNFPLVGKHRTVPCADCHLDGVMQGTPTACEACHWSRKNDDPYRLQLGLNCGECHTPLDWKIIIPGSWDHQRDAGFLLEGIHKTLDCFLCHKNYILSRQPNDCFSCHLEDYREADEPNHVAGNFPHDCKACHKTMLSWEGATFDHSAFPLRGAHQSALCIGCHGNGVYTGLPSQCVDCHLEDFNGTTEPNHQQAGYSTDCVGCHGDAAVTWAGATLDHTSFPLKGNHQTAACNACHVNNIYAGTPRECVGCHQDDYNNTTEPNHQQAGYSTDCVSCHGDAAVTWEGAAVNHTSFPLKGNHQTTACNDCHVNNVYAGTPKECVGCHQDDYNNTTEPNHQQAGYSTDCVSCHSDAAVTWEGAAVNHTSFPLKGNHQTTACNDCHVNNVYAGTPKECVGCHQDDFNNTTDPNHQQAGFPSDCVPCHGDAAITWDNAVFDHNQFWALQGAHLSLNCARCHDAGYQLPTDCYGCHKNDYDASTNPNHLASGFPTTCESCHLPTHFTWNQAVFNHKFPITSGDHRNISCTECHLTANYIEFSCIDCHEHSKNEMDEEHNDVSGYTYNSQACYTCHPTGNAD